MGTRPWRGWLQTCFGLGAGNYRSGAFAFDDGGGGDRDRDQFWRLRENPLPLNDAVSGIFTGQAIDAASSGRTSPGSQQALSLPAVSGQVSPLALWHYPAGTEHEAQEWQAAMEALILVATSGGPTMFARIGVIRALNRGYVRSLTRTGRDHHWSRRKLKRDE